jgi:hypothetical protein
VLSKNLGFEEIFRYYEIISEIIIYTKTENPVISRFPLSGSIKGESIVLPIGYLSQPTTAEPHVRRDCVSARRPSRTVSVCCVSVVLPVFRTPPDLAAQDPHLIRDDYSRLLLVPILET